MQVVYGRMTAVTAVFVRLNTAYGRIVYGRQGMHPGCQRYGTEAVHYGRKAVLYGDGAQPYT